MKYYHNIRPRRSHTLAPLTKLTSIKRNFKWTQVKQDAFDEIKKIKETTNMKPPNSLK